MMSSIPSRIALAIALALLAISGTACTRSSGATTLETSAVSRTQESAVDTHTIVGSWKPVGKQGLDARPDSVLTISPGGEWEEFGYTLHYRMRDKGRVVVWFNGAYTIHAIQVSGDTLTDHTPSGTVRRFSRVK